VAQKVTVILQDDLDGSTAAETVRFALDGVEYEIDLSEENARTFRRGLEPYIQRARRARRAQPRQQRHAVAGRETSTAIRRWAKERGIQVSDRGRIPANVAYEYEQRADRRVAAAGRRPPGPPSVPPRPPKPPKAL
jgi:Lsr2